MDDNVRGFNAEVAQYVQWDDHETRNNWYHEQVIQGDNRYSVKNVALLAARARQAMYEYTPIGVYPGNQPRVYRVMNRVPCSTCSCWTCGSIVARMDRTPRPR